MPYELKPPQPGRSPFYRVRGTEFGVYLDRSTKTRDRRKAQSLLAEWRAEVERDAISWRARKNRMTFASAALAYMQAGGETRFLAPLLKRFGDTDLTDIDQAAIDAAAVALYPDAKPATRNRQVYALVSVVMRRAGVAIALKRPAGSAPAPRLVWLRPAEANALLAAAKRTDARFGALLTFLLYCGPRLSEALRLKWADVDLTASTATLRDTKNGSDVTVHLPPIVVAELANLPTKKERVFGLTKCGMLYGFWRDTKKAAGITLPPRSAFHVLRHSHATWRRKYTGADTSALVETGLWKSRTAAAIYEHLDAGEEQRKSDLLPTPTRAKSVRKRKT
jgi:integrase